MQDTEKDPHCSPLSINLVNSQLNQLENDLFGKIITIKSYFKFPILWKKYIVYIQNFLLSKAEFVDVEVNEIQIN